MMVLSFDCLLKYVPDLPPWRILTSRIASVSRTTRAARRENFYESSVAPTLSTTCVRSFRLWCND